jgi:hypothetical protein
VPSCSRGLGGSPASVVDPFGDAVGFVFDSTTSTCSVSGTMRDASIFFARAGDGARGS